MTLGCFGQAYWDAVGTTLACFRGRGRDAFGEQLERLRGSSAGRGGGASEDGCQAVCPPRLADAGEVSWRGVPARLITDAFGKLEPMCSRDERLGVY